MRTGVEVYAQENSITSAAKEGNVLITHLIFNSSDNSFAVVTGDHNIIIHSLTTFECTKQVNLVRVAEYLFAITELSNFFYS